MGQFINPFSDWGFKLIFGQDINKDLLISFLNDLLKGEHVIQNISFLNNEQLPETVKERGLIYDVYCKTDKGTHIIVEMQNKFQPHFISRSIVYAARAVIGQAEKGASWDYDVESVYTVCFMNFITPELDERKFRTDVVLADRDDHRIVSDKLRFIYLQLPLFKKDEPECDNDFERWIYVLKNMETLKRMPFAAQNAVFQKLAQITNIAALHPEQRKKYDASIKAYRDTLATYEGSFLLGEKSGLEKGIQKGLEKGRQEECFRNARNMKKLGLDVAMIQKITGLTAEEIARL